MTLETKYSVATHIGWDAARDPYVLSKITDMAFNEWLGGVYHSGHHAGPMIVVDLVRGNVPIILDRWASTSWWRRPFTLPRRRTIYDYMLRITGEVELKPTTEKDHDD